MKNIVSIIILIFATNTFAQVFTGAKGFGSDWTFNQNYDVVVVTNTNASGSGSLKAAVETVTSSPSKIVVFNGLSGTITLTSAINIPSGQQIYIAAQTSENGILIRAASNENTGLILVSSNVSGVIISDIVLAVGATGNNNLNGDNLTLLSGDNMYFKNTTILWATDEQINPYGSNRITFDGCIIGEGLNRATHAYTTDPNNSNYNAPPNQTPHSMGALIDNGSTEISFYGTAFISNNQRNPLIGGGLGAGTDFEMVNSVVENWGFFGTDITGNSNVEMNIINTVYNKGVNSSSTRYGLTIGGSTKLYVDNVFNSFRTNDSQPDWDAVGLKGGSPFNGTNASTSFQSVTAFDYSLKDEPRLNKTEIETFIKGYAGTKFNHAHESRLLNQIGSTGASLIDNPSEVGGYPSIASANTIADSDSDGIPNDLESIWGDDTFGYVNSLTGVGNSTPTLIKGLTPEQVKKRREASILNL